MWQSQSGTLSYEQGNGWTGVQAGVGEPQIQGKTAQPLSAHPSPTSFSASQIAAIDRVRLFEEGQEPTGCSLRTVFSGNDRNWVVSGWTATGPGATAPAAAELPRIDDTGAVISRLSNDALPNLGKNAAGRVFSPINAMGITA